MDSASHRDRIHSSPGDHRSTPLPQGRTHAESPRASILRPLSSGFNSPAPLAVPPQLPRIEAVRTQDHQATARPALPLPSPAPHTLPNRALWLRGLPVLARLSAAVRTASIAQQHLRSTASATSQRRRPRTCESPDSRRCRLGRTTLSPALDCRAATPARDYEAVTLTAKTPRARRPGAAGPQRRRHRGTTPASRRRKAE